MNTFQAVDPALVLCDLSLVGMDDFELIKAITQIKKNIPIIVISTAGQINDVVGALRFGATDYKVKPIIDFEEFDFAINSALVNKHGSSDWHANPHDDLTREDNEMNPEIHRQQLYQLCVNP